MGEPEAAGSASATWTRSVRWGSSKTCSSPARICGGAAVTMPPEEALKTVIKVAIAHEISHPHYGRVLLHEAMQNQGQYFKLTGWVNPINRVIAVVERGIQAGIFRSVDPWLAVNHMMGICTFYFNAQANMRNVQPEFEWFTSEAIERFTESAIAMVLAGLKA